MSQSKIQWLAGLINDLGEDDLSEFLSRIRPLSRKECAAILGVSERTIDRWVAEDPDFPVLRLRSGRYSYHFFLGSVFKYLRGRR